MSKSPIPDSVDGRKVFAQQAHIDGELAIERFGKSSKINDLLAGLAGLIRVSLDFASEPQLGRVIRGHLSARIQVSCQRCLHALDIEVADDIRLAVLDSVDQLDRLKRLEELDKQLDPWFCSDDSRVDLVRLIEEQLLLSIPIVNYHDDGKCMERIGYSSDQAWIDASNNGTIPANPFAVLSKLKHNKRKDESDS